MKQYFIIILICSSIVAFASNDRKMYSYSQNIETFASILKELNTHYVDTIDIDKATQIGISAMLSELDPYTIYFTEKEAKQFEEQSAGEYAGVGCTIVQRDNGVYISEPFENTPAQEAGIRAGDKIVMIDNDTVLTLKSDEVSKRMRGLPNTKLKMHLERQGCDSLIEVNLTRRIIQHNPVTYYGTLADSIGYIFLETFSQHAAEEVRNAVLSLKKNNDIKALILDLRNNTGGLVNEAIEIINMFVPRGTIVLKSKSKISENNHVYRTTKEPIDTIMPLAVLTDFNTASASEVVAGALQDLDRAVIIGERSFGKGLIQQLFPLPFNRKIKITMAYYYTPSGRSIQAIDYSRRDAEGKAIRVPDSLTNEFTTSKGRIVRDGGGITPDVVIKPDTMSNLMYYLFIGNHIFDYATKYATEHDSIPPVHEFYLTDADYENFKEFIHQRDFKYDKMSSKILDDLSKMMTFEGYIDENSKQLIDSLSQLLEHNVNKDLDTFRKEIESSILYEIATRYYFRRGAILIKLRNEPVTTSAIEILLSPEQYHKILSPEQQ